MRIDAHHHLWQRSLPFDYSWLEKPALAPICRDFLPDDLLPHLQHCGIDQTVVVQTQHTVDESRWMLSLAEQFPWIAGVVGWVDLASPACEDQLQELRAHSKFVGVRHIVQDEPDENFIIRPQILQGLKVLEKHGCPYDLLFYVQHLQHAVAVAQHVPGLPLVIDHLSKPQIKDRGWKDWEQDLRAAAKLPNVYCKISGLVTEADWQNWQPQDLKPYVELALETFGPQRCMYGSDWPVCLLAAEYEEVHAAAQQVLGSLSADEQSQVFGRTAQQFYRLSAADKVPAA
ncbi:amidohydrolase family protein [Planctomicrobium sp. SH664]|uniref:amidohydrolase family protein n=1 Tax=Planctomicrobium sp. SH664 TaxID=3448125 RepID=UPI003F5B876E